MSTTDPVEHARKDDQIMRSTFALAAAAIAATTVGFASVGAHAAALTLNLSPSTMYQQQNNTPCVIGDPSCHNPSGFGSTTVSNGATQTNIGSPVYTVQQIRDIAGNGFMVGIDVNTTTHPLATEILDSFSLAINGTTQFLYTGPTQFIDNNNGNGWSDALLSGFDLSSFLGTATAQFFTTYHNATDGREEFFLISGNTPGTGVPEPGALGLLGLGFAGLVAFARKRRGVSSRPLAA
jgi:hypothetical protein